MDAERRERHRLTEAARRLAARRARITHVRLDIWVRWTDADRPNRWGLWHVQDGWATLCGKPVPTVGRRLQYQPGPLADSCRRCALIVAASPVGNHANQESR